MFYTHENLFPNFYIINLPSILGIQFLDGVGGNIVKLYALLYTIYKFYGNGLILYIIDRLWKAGGLCKKTHMLVALPFIYGRLSSPLITFKVNG